MKKISTFFKKDPNDLGRVINEIDPKNEWVLKDGIPTRKYDGTASAIINGELYKRYDVKRGRQIPVGAIPCQEADEFTGHHPHWLKCDRLKKEDKYFFEAFDKNEFWADGTYELIGEKVQGNPEKIIGHELVPHGYDGLNVSDFSFDSLRIFLQENDIEGIVFHDKNSDRMCKLRKSDFGIKR